MATFCLFAVVFWRPEGERLVGVLDGQTGSSGSLSLPWTVSSSSPSQKDSQWHSLASANVMDPAGGGGDSSSCQVRMSVPCALSRTEGWATGVLTLWALIHHGNRTTSYSAMCDAESKCI